MQWRSECVCVCVWQLACLTGVGQSDVGQPMPPVPAALLAATSAFAAAGAAAAACCVLCTARRANIREEDATDVLLERVCREIYRSVGCCARDESLVLSTQLCHSSRSKIERKAQQDKATAQ